LLDAITNIFKPCPANKSDAKHHKIDATPKSQIELRIYKSMIDLLNFRIIEYLKQEITKLC